ncbi:MAG: alpha/beta hydrolase [Actinomycetota bacterium]|nr:alpha/beta hydrolase [Actinomycetota bacterium]
MLRSSSETFSTDDGLTLSYETWGPDGGPGPVILCHGFAVDTRVNWVAPGIAERLTRAGARVVGLDARGHGRSDKPHDEACYGEERMAADVVALLDHLGASRVALVGYSMGAEIAALVASTDRRVAALVLGGVGAGMVERDGPGAGAGTNAAIAEALVSDDPAVTSRPEVAGFRMLADFIRADRVALAAVARSARSAPMDLHAISAPTLVLAGTEDAMAERPEVLASAIDGAVLVPVPGDHLGAVGQPAFADTLVSFVAAQLARPGPPG